MAQGVGTLFRMMAAGLLLLAALVLSAAPGAAHAHGIAHAHGTAQAHGADAQYAAHHAPPDSAAAPAAAEGGTAASAHTAPAAPTDGAGCVEPVGGDLGCCVGSACSLMHGGIPPAGQPIPVPPEVAALALRPSRLSEGVGTLPALKPPRLSV